MKLLKALFPILDRVAPAISAHIAYRFMSNPQVRKLRDFEEEVLAQSEKKRIDFKGFEIQAYAWGDPCQPLAFLIHGWEGQSGNFGALVPILLEKGYCVMAFDGPSHGKSSKGNTGMFEYAELITEMMAEYHPQILVSHSFGSVSTVYSLLRNTDLEIAQWFAITTPYSFRERLADIKAFLGITDRTGDRVIKKLERYSGHKIEEMNMAVMGPRLKNVKELTIIHSKTDRVLRIEAARKSAKVLPNAELIELDGVGHYAILWAEETKNILKEGLKEAKGEFFEAHITGC